MLTTPHIPLTTRATLPWRAWRYLAEVWRHNDVDFTEILVGVQTILCGFVLLLPTQSTFDAAPHYNMLARLIRAVRLDDATRLSPEAVWGVACVALGGFLFMASLGQSIFWRRRAVFVVGLFWAGASGLIIASGAAVFVVVFVPCLAASALWVFWRLDGQLKADKGAG